MRNRETPARHKSGGMTALFDSDDERDKNRELFSAIRNGNLQRVQELLKAGVKVNIIDKNNKDNTPLQYAIEREKEEIAEKLLQEWESDINAKNNKGDTPLHVAVSKGHKDIVVLLLKEGAKINIENNAGKSPLSLANELDDGKPNKQSIIQMLDQSWQKDNKRKRKQSPSDRDKRQKFDQDNSSNFAEETLNQQDYQVWLTQEDVANIARFKYGWYGENSNVLFEVIGSVEQLYVELKKREKILKAPSKQSLIFIINLNSNHWVTLVIIHQNDQFSAYYINSSGDEITSDIHDKLNSAMPGIQISNPKFKQQEDGYNCGIFALENARIINDEIKSGKTNLEIEQALKGYELTSDDLKNKRKEYAEELQQQKAKLDYEGSTLNDSSDKKSSSNEIQKPKAEKRPNNEYSKSGLVHTLHGDIYQLKLLMLFVKRAFDRGYLFELATEMDVAEKFDDLVFQYKKNNADGTEEKVGRFLQAKHKQDEDKRISVNALLTEKNGDFNLQKYFISYRKIERNPVFKNSNLQYKEFIICTNIGFKFGDKRSNLELSEDIFDHETDENEILNTKLFQFKDEFTGREEIFSVLRNAPDLTKLAKRLAECVLDGKSINDDKSEDDPEGNLFKLYQSALIDEVIDKESYKLSVDFVNGQQLSSKAENLRAAFEKVFDDRRKSFNLDDEPNIRNLEKFAQEIAKLISISKKKKKSQPKKGIKIEKRKHVIKDNFHKLAGYVLIKKDNKIKFSTAFLNDHKLPGNLNTFREKLQSELPKLKFDECEFETYKDFKTCEEIYVDKDNFWENIKEKKLRLFKDFGKLDIDLQSTEKFVKKFISLLEESESKINLVVKIKRADKIINKNIDKLAQHVLIEKEDGIRFSSEFLSDTLLPGNLNDFRSKLKAKVKELNLDLNVLKEYKFHISNFPKFNLPNDSIKEIEENIKDFLKKLRFAVNQPNEDKLGEMIKGELGEEFNTIDSKNVYSRFLEKMLDWMKDKKGKFLSHEEAKTFFEKLRKEILGAIWFNMKDPVTLFTGRKEELSDLHKSLQRNQGKAEFTVTCISGLGGIGKSELARKYAYDHENDYAGNVIWINAENHETLKDSFLKLARDNRLGIPKIHRDGKEKTVEATVKEIYFFFANGKESLFIFDNAEKNDYLKNFLPIRGLPPKTNKPYVLITSRHKEWEKVIEVIDLSELKLVDAIEFVKKGLGISEEDESQDQEMENLVKKLQLFPLAIQQAIAYIEDQRVTGKFEINDYLKEYQIKTKDLLDSKVFKGIDNNYAKTTFKTWKITIDKIASNEQHGKLALKILDIISYFAPENICREIFLSLAKGDEEKLKSTSRLLVEYSMVNGRQKQSVLSIHRLVQEVIRINLKDREENVLREALELLRDNIEKCDVDHPISVWDYASSHHKLVEEFSNLPRMIVDKLFLEMKYSKTFSFGKKALESLKKLGDKHYEVVKMKRYLANAYGYAGDHNEKRRLLEDEVLPFLEKYHSDEHLEIAHTLKNLGVVYGDLKKFRDQIENLKKAFVIFKKFLTDDSIEIAKTKRNLANAYGDLGYYKVKRRLLEDEVLPILNEHHSGRFLEIAKVLRNLGIVYGDLKKYDDKIKYLEKALDIFKNHLGDESIEVAATKRNLANAYGKLNKPYEKKRLLKYEVLPILKRHHPERFLEIGKALRNFGNVHGDLKEYDNKIKYLEEALNNFKKHPGDASIEIADTKLNLAKAYGKKGFNEKKRKLILEEVIPIFKKYYGDYHPKVDKAQKALESLNLALFSSVSGI